LNIYMFNRIGLTLMILLIMTLLSYFYLQFDDMRKGYKDTFSSVLIDFDYSKNEVSNLDKDSNFMMFFELKFGDINFMQQMGIVEPKKDENKFAFDVHHKVNLKRLNQFIRFDLKMRKRTKDG